MADEKEVGTSKKKDESEIMLGAFMPTCW